ncbi:MAG: hypothetical protein HY243_10210 [Proteobacteria bacterium]|nr:hypothetical protein [Pseudomonadota bacterium]
MTNRTAPQKDWTRQPLSFGLWWELPIALGAFASLLHLSFRIGAGICAVLFVWMAIGCLLNARRCHRLHCYISGPVFLLGALVAGLNGAGVLALGPHSLNNIAGVTLGLALLSFIPEIVWRRYA